MVDAVLAAMLTAVVARGPAGSAAICGLRQGLQLCSCNDGPHKPSRCLSPPSEAPHRLFGPSLRSKPVTPADLPREPRVQRFSRFRVAAVDIKPSTAACIYPAPLPDKRALAEHRLLDGEHVVPSHVQAIVPTVEHQDLKATVEGRQASVIPGWFHAQSITSNAELESFASIDSPP